MQRLLFSIPVALFLVLAIYFGAALFSGRDPHQLTPTLIDEPVPAFALDGLGAQGLSREALAGQVTLVNFFASWCVPCRAEHPLLMRLAEQEHVPVYGIAYKDKPENAARFIAQLGNPFRGIGLDESGRTGIDFGVTGVPETFVIDKTGRIRRHYNLPLTPEQLRDELLPLLRDLGRS
jgi:cytochrome c biogenesis protein CcmG, thiol:disulfide interchange protein DsbE